MSHHLPESVRLLFQQLADEYAVKVEQPTRSGSFDQLVQIAHGKNLGIRFVRDRGDEFLEVGFGNCWFSPDLLRIVLSGGDGPQDAPIVLQEQASILQQHFAEIERLFSTANRGETLRRLDELRNRLERRMFPSDFFLDAEG